MYYYMTKSLDYIKVDTKDKKSVLKKLEEGYKILCTADEHETNYDYNTEDKDAIKALKDFCKIQEDYNYCSICITKYADCSKCYVCFLKVDDDKKLIDADTIHIASVGPANPMFAAEQQKVKELEDLITVYDYHNKCFAHGEDAIKLKLQKEVKTK